MFDVLYTVIFIIFFFYLRNTFSKEATKVEDENITTSDYALEVFGLPRSGIKEEDVK